METQDRQRIVRSLGIALGLVGFMWVLHFLLWLLDIDPGVLGTVPGKAHGLLGILTSPLVHADLSHIAANSGPMIVFTAAILYFYPKVAWKAIPLIWFLEGMWVWLMAHDGAHIGASGMVYGLGAFLFFSGVFRRDVRSIRLTLVIAFVYGSMVWGVLPGQPNVSWESHLFGALAGAGIAWFYRKVDLPERKRYAWEDEPEQHPDDANAAWNYRENWSGANQLIHPSDPEQDGPRP
jgi:membrane associated rhomboid family serine protease